MNLTSEAFQATWRSPHDLVLAAGGRASPFGDLGDGATAAGTANDIRTVECLNLGWKADIPRIVANVSYSDERLQARKGYRAPQTNHCGNH